MIKQGGCFILKKLYLINEIDLVEETFNLVNLIIFNNFIFHNFSHFIYLRVI